VLDRLLVKELGQRDERRGKTSLKLANLPPGETLGDFDFGFPPAGGRRAVATPATRGLFRGHNALLVPGPPRVGEKRPYGGRGGGGQTAPVCGAGRGGDRAGLQCGLLPAGGTAARDAQGRARATATAAAEEVLQRGLPDRR